MLKGSLLLKSFNFSILDHVIFHGWFCYQYYSLRKLACQIVISSLIKTTANLPCHLFQYGTQSDITVLTWLLLLSRYWPEKSCKELRPKVLVWIVSDGWWWNCYPGRRPRWSTRFHSREMARGKVFPSCDV